MSAAQVIEPDPGPRLHAVPDLTPTRRTRPSCSPRHRTHCSADHLALVSGYRDQRDARDALRESDTVVDVAGAAGANVSAYQLEEEEFDRAYPRVTFKDWLVGQAGRNRAPEEQTA